MIQPEEQSGTEQSLEQRRAAALWESHGILMPWLMTQLQA
jgi:hypothetical protein